MWTIPEHNIRGRVLMSLDIAFLVLAWISFVVRLYARSLTRVRLDASDYTCFAGLLLSIGLTVILWAVYSHGWGLDIRYFTPEYQIFAGKLFVAIVIIWNTAVTMVRVSMLLFYIRIFSVSKLKPAFWITLGLNIAACLAICIAALTICRPFEQAYNPRPGGHCGNIVALQDFTGYWNLFADAAIVALPMPILWSLKMNTRRKIGLSIILGMGVIICIGTITRVILSAVYETNNLTKKNAIVVFITGMEPIIGVINACLPHFPPVFRKFGSSRFATSVSQVFRSDKSNLSGSTKRSTGKWGSAMSSASHKKSFVTLDDDTMELNNSYRGLGAKGGIQVTSDYTVERPMT
ncbi:hypothetical protein M011DRAFT_480145 [Sporormia fimetaria CBS 119925]|uniref:Rhodopsin domain-containing protein n=1 Tax=Sporormia fimetaria CBS 119925 TaxID=1340428 RepID=A0A6A6V4F3_9PLEO|nr:hypothetical protein M011DRAFT_480145 [Sporormia fimetaria CBS 119925]